MLFTLLLCYYATVWNAARSANCKLLERNQRLALGLQIRNPDLAAKYAPKYTDFTKGWARKDPQLVGMIHDKLTELVKLAKQSQQRSRSHSFPTMNREKRQVIYEKRVNIVLLLTVFPVLFSSWSTSCAPFSESKRLPTMRSPIAMWWPLLTETHPGCPVSVSFSRWTGRAANGAFQCPPTMPGEWSARQLGWKPFAYRTASTQLFFFYPRHTPPPSLTSSHSSSIYT